jgi:hypothetical protein
MIGAVAIHRQRREPAGLQIVLAVLTFTATVLSAALTF